MTITFENDNDAMVYLLAKIINYARENHYIFVSHCVWWLASIIGLESWLVMHIDNLRIRDVVAEIPDQEIAHGSFRRKL